MFKKSKKIRLPKIESNKLVIHDDFLKIGDSRNGFTVISIGIDARFPLRLF